MVAVSGNTLVGGRPREHNGNSTEFKFVLKSYSGGRGTNHRSRRSHVKLVQDENKYL